MRDVLVFVFSSFWVFFGTVILLAVVLDGLADVAKALRSPSATKLEATQRTALKPEADANG